MTITTASHIALSELMTGAVVGPDDHSFAAAHTGFNLALDQPPAAVAFPVDADDVAAVVDFAREHGLRIAPQATGHNPGPLGSLEDVILLSVAELDEVTIDAAARRVRVGAGVRWRDVTPQLSDLGLAALHGSSPDVGVAGYSLGGGMGWLARKHGLQTNSVTAIELVTADGRLVRADHDHEPELFWALRGGGGNFGVVTAIEFSVYPVAEVYAGAMFFPFERADEVLHAWAATLPSLPDEMMTWAVLLHFPDAPEVPEPVRGGSFTIVMSAFLGDESAGRELLAPVSDLGPLMDTRAMVPPVGLSELAMDPRDPLPYMTGHRLLDDLSPAAVDDILAVAGPGSGAPLAMVQLRHMGGALARVEPGAGVRATLPGAISVLALGVLADDETAAAVRASIVTLEAVIDPYAAGDYPNFVEEPADASAFFGADDWARLRYVKAAYDPADMFKGNHHIPPAR